MLLQRGACLNCVRFWTAWKGTGGSVLPVFCGVEPSDVGHQRGSFAEAFDEHVKEFGEDSKEVEMWRDALSKVAKLAGWNLKDYRYETDLMKEIVQELWSKVRPTLPFSDSADRLVGMDAKIMEIDVLLDTEANDVRFIGIWGMGGVGKTTLARVVYEKISHQFEVCIFLAKVKEVYATPGLVRLQEQILSQILKEKNVQVWDVYDGMTRIKRCVCNKAVLLVLDDVDKLEQLKILVGEKGWFGLRSRIIITTRNRHVLVAHGIEEPYELKGLNNDEALQLFSLNAFRKYEPEEDYAELSDSFVSYSRGLPLALETLGSFLYKRSPGAWESALEKLRNTPDRTVFDVLKVSYDGLDEMEKKVFLDITCFSSVFELLYSSDVCIRIAIDVLAEKSLLTISPDNKIGMHDLIQAMGCEIVLQESHEPGGRSRLWLRKDIFHVFRMNTGTEAIEGIFLHLPELEEADWNLKDFSKMYKLKLLYIHNLKLSLSPNCLPDALRFLYWSWYPSKSLPQGFQPDELTELSLIHSNIDHLWNGRKYLDKLKSIDLSYSINLTKTPDFTDIQNLEKLVLEGCTNLVHIHPSIALLKKLKIWNFRNCRSIKSLPSEVEMEFLETFDVSGCSKLKMIPEFVGQMKRLSKLCLSCTAVEKLPSSIERFSESLVELQLCGIVIRELPFSLFLKQNLRLLSFGLFPTMSTHPLSPLLASLKHLSLLTSLNLNDCNLSEGDIPDDIGSLSSLQWLELGGNNFVTLPASIHLLSNLNSINVENCKRLQRMPALPLNSNLWVGTSNCTSLQVFSDQSVPNLDSSSFLYSILKRMRLLQEAGCSYDFLCILLPGIEIPMWFNNQSVGDSITEKIPSYASNSRKWMGFAVCALFAAHDDPSTVPEDPSFDPDESSITCNFDSYGFSSGTKQIGSDHLFSCVFSTHYWEPENCPEDTLVTFAFRTYRAVGNNRCFKIKKCGARALYEDDMEELIAQMKQSKSKSAYEEGGAVVAEEQFISCSSDDEILLS